MFGRISSVFVHVSQLSVVPLRSRTRAAAFDKLAPFSYACRSFPFSRSVPVVEHKPIPNQKIRERRLIPKQKTRGGTFTREQKVREGKLAPKQKIRGKLIVRGRIGQMKQKIQGKASALEACALETAVGGSRFLSARRFKAVAVFLATSYSLRLRFL